MSEDELERLREENAALRRENRRAAEIVTARDEEIRRLYAEVSAYVEVCGPLPGVPKMAAVRAVCEAARAEHLARSHAMTCAPGDFDVALGRVREARHVVAAALVTAGFALPLS